ncbi:MAG: Sua5/YciO/YrdC/YwlC family protein [Mariprofundales bacterium]
MLQRCLLPKRLSPLRAGYALRSGWLVAHQSNTLPGVAALANHPCALQRLQRFKQRQGPFLLLIADRRRLRHWLARLTPLMRRVIAHKWSPDVTLLLPASQRVPIGCRHRGKVAVRLVADPPTRRMIEVAGGALLSSSLNRSGGDPASPSLRWRYRWHRHRLFLLEGGQGSGNPSTLLDLCGRHPIRLR